MVAVGLSAQTIASTQRLVGYCDGDSVTCSGIGFGSQGNYSVGALATQSLLRNYVGCNIVGIRFAVSESIGKTSVFIAPVENQTVGENLVNQTVRRTSEGWNTVFFNSGNEYKITGEEQLLFGFNYTEEGDGALDIYIPKEPKTNTFLVMPEGTGKWTDNSDMGVLCVQLIVDVSSMPEKKVGLSNLLIGTYYKKPGEKINYYVEYANVGRESIESCQIAYQIDNGEVTYLDNTTALKEGASESLDAYMSLPEDISTGTHTFRFFTSQIDGQPVGDAMAEIAQNFVVYRNAAMRQQHYVEQYNSQQSYYGSLVNDGMNKVASEDDNVCLVNIYEDGSPLSVAESVPFVNTYAYTYPCFTVDRFYFFGEYYMAFDVNDYVAIYPAIVTEGLRSIVYEANANPAFANLDIQSEYDADTREFKLNVVGEVTEDAEAIFGSMALTVLLTEDNIKGNQTCLNNMTGATYTNKNYIHNNVLRTYVSAPMGDMIALDDNMFSATYTVKVADGWVPANMKAVAFVTRKADAITDDNVREMDITNCYSISLADSVSGISLIPQPSSLNQYYTLDGKSIDASDLKKGVYIQRDGNKTRKIIIK